MAGTVKQTNVRRAAETFLLCPGAHQWEVWALTPNEPSRFVSACATPKEAQLPKKSIVALPIRHVYAQPLWLTTDDPALLNDLIFFQIERRGILRRSREETVLNFHSVARDGSHTLVLTEVLTGNLPEELLLNQVPNYDLSARFYPLPPDQITIWKEIGRLVVAVTRGEKLAYFQTLGDDVINALVLQELLCIKMQLETQKVIGHISQITLWGEFTPLEIQNLNQTLQMNVRPWKRPAPQVPHQRGSLVPIPVKNAQITAARQKHIRKFVSAGVAIYIFILLSFGGYLAWLKYQSSQIKSRLQEVAADVTLITNTTERWLTLRPAIDPQFFPIENLLFCASSIQEGVRLVTFEQLQEARNLKITVRGEGKDYNSISLYKEALNEKRNAADPEWQMIVNQLPTGAQSFTISN